MSEVCRLIKDALETGLPSTLRVEGELSGLSSRNHWYFTLKDEQGVLQCVAWASAAARFGFVPTEGELVVATGSVSHYAPQGRTQFYVTRLEPAGTGALAIRFRALCDELRRLGYFDEAHKIPLPPMPRRIAVITSATGAAMKDVIDTARRRSPAVGLLIVDVRVQGEGAAEQVADAIALVDRHAAQLGIDAILVTRGGGSIEDLWAFNERVVADAVFRCRLPLVAAIGHESDTTVIELVADRRAATPTQAVMHLLPDVRELLAQLTHLRERLSLLSRRRLDAELRRLDAVRRNELLRRPGAIVARHRERLALFGRSLQAAQRRRMENQRRDWTGLRARLERVHPTSFLRARRGELRARAERLRSAITTRVTLRRKILDGQIRALRAVDPKAILDRGYSITTRPDGSVLRRVCDASAGLQIQTRLADGTLRSIVTDDEGRAGSGSTGIDRGGRRRQRRGEPSTGSMDLFGGAE